MKIINIFAYVNLLWNWSKYQKQRTGLSTRINTSNKIAIKQNVSWLKIIIILIMVYRVSHGGSIQFIFQEKKCKIPQINYLIE